MPYFEENIIFLKSVSKNGVRTQYVWRMNYLNKNMANKHSCTHAKPLSKHVAT
jgi:hypothetical protein